MYNWLHTGSEESFQYFIKGQIPIDLGLLPVNIEQYTKFGMEIICDNSIFAAWTEGQRCYFHLAVFIALKLQQLDWKLVLQNMTLLFSIDYGRNSRREYLLMEKILNCTGIPDQYISRIVN